jgi:hypothetical protein
MAPAMTALPAILFSFIVNSYPAVLAATRQHHGTELVVRLNAPAVTGNDWLSNRVPVVRGS